MLRSKQINMDFVLFNEASRLEADNPSRSLELYSELERENKVFNFKQIIVETLLPVVGFVLALWLSTSYGMSSFLVTLFVWVGICYMPSYIMSMRRLEKARGYTEKERFKKLGDSKFTYYFYDYFLVPFIGYLGTTIVFIFIAAIAALFVAALHYAVAYTYHLVTNVPFENIREALFPYFATYVMCVVFFIVFFLSASDVPFKEIFSLKKILIGVKVNLKNIMLVFRDMLILLILGGGSMGIFYNQPFYGVSISIVVGITSGLSSAWSEKDWVLGEILKVAKIRCLIYSGRIIEAKYSLNLLMHLKGHPEEIDEMLLMIACFFKDDTTQVCHNSQNVSSGSDSRYQDIYNRNFQLIEDLLNYRFKPIGSKWYASVKSQGQSCGALLVPSIVDDNFPYE